MHFGTKTWQRQPKGVLSLDMSSRFNVGLAFHNAGKFRHYDLAQGMRGGGSGTGTWSQLIRAGEVATGTTSNSFTKTQFASLPQYDLLDSWTFAIRILRLAGTFNNSQKVWSRGNSGNNTWQFNMPVSGGSGNVQRLRLSWTDSAGVTTTSDASGMPAISTNKFDTWIFTYDGANMTTYVNGIQRSQIAATGFMAAQTNVMRFGEDTVNASASVAVSLAHIVKRAWSASEAKKFSRNPWQIYTPRASFDVMSSGAAGVTVTLDIGGNVEVLTSTVASRGAYAETLYGMRADSAVFDEIQSQVQLNTGIADELLFGSQRSTATQTEQLATTVRSVPVWIEELITLPLVSGAATLELLGIVRREMIMQGETLSQTLRELRVWDEALSGAFTALNNPLEMNVIMQRNVATQEELAGALSIETVNTIPLELQTQIQRNAMFADEMLSTTRHDARVSLETLGSVLQQAAVAVEELTRFNRDVGEPFELLVSFAGTTLDFPLEISRTVIFDANGNVEWLGVAELSVKAWTELQGVEELIITPNPLYTLVGPAKVRSLIGPRKVRILLSRRS